jgi:hypothetical protein
MDRPQFGDGNGRNDEPNQRNQENAANGCQGNSHEQFGLQRVKWAAERQSLANVPVVDPSKA